MNEVLHANIFFIIASLATVIFCILISLALYQVFKILRLFRSIMERIESTSEIIAKDVSNVRESMGKGGLFMRIISIILGAAGESRRKESSDK